eukprot:TRINITY_DN3587_c0_g2_i4.p1 TRINITY_DN3587_c0_g2~~TRINITY_DN3587_c0_g2_i4.p1  ORF type:complete len:713 (-),score=118.63 TRINITY_DN3587_c0_g2_i4:238-2376(-)
MPKIFLKTHSLNTSNNNSLFFSTPTPTQSKQARGRGQFNLSRGKGQLNRVKEWNSTRGRGRGRQINCQNQQINSNFSDDDYKILQEVAKLADSSAGLTVPHPNAACLLINGDGKQIGSGFQLAQGSASCEVLAVENARQNGVDSMADCTAYLNLEPGNCHGENAAVQALISSGVSKVFIGLLHPLSHLRGHAVRQLLSAGIDVFVLGPSTEEDSEEHQIARKMCLEVNDALIHRGALGRPMSILKYAMTLDGKIATNTGHSAWVSGTMARARVFKARARSHAVIVGGNTLRRDNPRLTTRQEGGHRPTRIVMSRTMDLRQDANLWDVTNAPTIVMTQRGARVAFQTELRDQGVEVVEFDFLTPDNVSQYLFQRGYLRCLWECGGTLASPAIADNTIHKVMAFVSPKIIGGVSAPSPVGDLGHVEMTQALDVTDVTWEQISQDFLLQGYLPSSGGLENLEQAIDSQSAYQRHPTLQGVISPRSPQFILPQIKQQQKQLQIGQPAREIIQFYQVWDKWGAFSNFSPHPVKIEKSVVSTQYDLNIYKTSEHYYQSKKFSGNQSQESQQIAQQIISSDTPEQAAIFGRKMFKERQDLITPDFLNLRIQIMRESLMSKFTQHKNLKKLLLSTGDCDLVESSPQDYFWGCGIDGQGENNLGKLLMEIREILQQEKNSDSDGDDDFNDGVKNGNYGVSKFFDSNQVNGQQQQQQIQYNS